MRRKLFTFLVAFLATLSGAVWGDTYNLSSMSGTTNLDGGEHTITGTATEEVRFTVSGNVTITLDNANFAWSRNSFGNQCPLELQNGANLTLKILGNNVIESKRGVIDERAAGIYVPEGTSLIVDKESTGQLTVYGRVAIGANLVADCGNIDIQGGTIVAVGMKGTGLWTPASIGGNSIVGSRSGSVTVSNDGVLIAAQAVNVPDKHFNGGIVFDASTEGKVIGSSVTLKSPLDLNNLHLTVPNGSVLKLGEGKTITSADNITVEDGGDIYAYRIEYNQSIPNSYIPSGSDLLAELPTPILCGPNTSYTLPDWPTPRDFEATSGSVYQELHDYWLNENNQYEKINTQKTTASQEPGSIKEETNVEVYKAIWVLKEKTLGYEATTGISDPEFVLWFPGTAPFSVREISSGQLTAAGLAIDDSNNKLKKTDPFTILTEGDYNVVLKVEPKGIQPEGLENTQINVHVNQDPLDLDDQRVTIKLSSVQYNGQNVNNNEVAKVYIDYVEGASTPIDPGQYEVWFNSNDVDVSGIGWTNTVKGVGSYYVKLKGKGDPNEGAFTNKEIKVEDQQFNITKASLTINAGENKQWNLLNTDQKPDLASNFNVSGIWRDDDVKITATPTVTGIEETSGSNWETVPGTYKVTLSINSPSGKDANNYEVTPTSVEFNLNVLKYYNGGEGGKPDYPDELMPDGSDWKWDGNAFSRVYDGTAKEISSLKIKDVNSAVNKVEGTPSEENQGFTVSYKKDESNLGQAPKDCGEYIAVINIWYKNYVAKDIEMPLKITQRPLKVSVKQLDADLSKQSITESDVEFENAGENRGLVDGETLGVSGTVEIKEKEGEPGKYTATFSELKITNKDSYKADNYSAEFLYGEQTISEDPIDINPGDVEGEVKLPENSGWKFKDNTYYRTYDGETHNIDKVFVDGSEKKPTSVSYQYTNDLQSTSSVKEVRNAGSYKATINIDGKIATLNLRIDKRTLKAEILDQAIEYDENIDSGISDKTVKFSGNVEGEIVSCEGNLELEISELKPGHKYIDAIEFSDNFGIADDDVNNFKASNYECELFNGDLIVKQSIDPTDPVDPTDPKDPDNPIIIPGEDNNDEWTWDADKKAFVRTYDGEEHPITKLWVKITENDKVNYEEVTVKAVYAPSTPKDVVDDGYTAKVTIEENDYIKAGTITLKLMIIPADLSVDFNIPDPLTEEEALAWNSDRIGLEGLVGDENPSIPSDCHLEIDDNKVVLKNFVLNDNKESGFKKSNYNVTYYNCDSKIDITEGGEIEIPGIEIDDNDGGIIVDYNDLHIIKSTGAKLTSRYNKMRVKDGGSFTLSLEKEEGYEDCEPTVYIKRGRFDEWKVLKLDEVSGFYQIRNVYTDIYVKVSGDGIWPVSNEEVEAQEVKVYTQNGAIVVVTPSVMDVQVVSMTGSVVAADKVAGQREFRNLAEGVYIVRVGDKIVKIRL